MTQTVPDSGYASVPALWQYLRMAESRGVDTTACLARAGIDPSVLQDARQRVPGQQLEQLLACLIPLSGDPCFGLHTSAFIQPASYSVLGYIAMNCATVGEALSRIPVYEKIVGDMGFTVTRALGENVCVQWNCNFTNPLVRRHVIENVLASWTRYTRWMTGEETENPQEVWFEHGPPEDAAALAEYQSLFRAPVRFNQSCSTLIVAPRQLQHALRQADPQLLATLLEHATQVLATLDRDESVSRQVKNLLRLQLKDELPRKELIARQLGMNARTLQRRLSEEGTSYQQVLNELRLELAQHYLRHSTLTIDEIGVRLGFAEPRSFHRSFKQWTGMTPGEFRLSG